jgi:Transposase, Mutator family
MASSQITAPGRLRARPADAKDTQAEHAHPGPPRPSRLGGSRRGDRTVPGTCGRHRVLPLPRQPHPHTMGEPGHRNTRSGGLNTWGAGCGGSRTSGSEGGPQKPTRRKSGRALRPDPYTELPNRGVQDTFIVCCDGLKGLPDAIRATWPHAEVQLCLVHLVRLSLRYTAKKHWGGSAGNYARSTPPPPWMSPRPASASSPTPGGTATRP